MLNISNMWLYINPDYTQTQSCLSIFPQIAAKIWPRQYISASFLGDLSVVGTVQESTVEDN